MQYSETAEGYDQRQHGDDDNTNGCVDGGSILYCRQCHTTNDTIDDAESRQSSKIEQYQERNKVLAKGKPRLDKLSHTRLRSPRTHVCHRHSARKREEKDNQCRVPQTQCKGHGAHHAESHTAYPLADMYGASSPADHSRQGVATHAKPKREDL